MNKHRPCDFGMAIKSKLLEMNQTQTWLIEEVKKCTGLYVDSSLMFKITTTGTIRKLAAALGVSVSDIFMG